MARSASVLFFPNSDYKFQVWENVIRMSWILFEIHPRTSRQLKPKLEVLQIDVTWPHRRLIDQQVRRD